MPNDELQIASYKLWWEFIWVRKWNRLVGGVMTPPYGGAGNRWMVQRGNWDSGWPMAIPTGAVRKRKKGRVLTHPYGMKC